MAEKSSDRMETDTNKPDIEKLRPIVKMEYAKISAASNSRKEMEIKAILEENSRKLDSLRPNAFKINSVAPMKFFDEKISGKSPLPIASTSKCSVKILTTNQTEHVPIRILPEIKPLPVMFSWVSVQQNYAVEDEKVLPNIPYMGDNVEDVFVEDLRDHYEHGIHGIAKSAFLNDEMFFDLVQNVAKQINSVDDGDVLENPPDNVFAAISNVFPDKGTVGDLKSKFRDLLEKHKGISLTSADQCNPNIDGPGAVSASAEQTMHSFSHLFCRRCYKYDCYMHPTHTLVTNVKRKPPDLNLSEYICEHCYLTLPEYSDDVKDSSNLDNVETKPSIADDVQRPKPKRIGVGRPKKIQPSDDDASVKSETSSVKPKPPKRRELDLNFDPGEWTPAEESIYRGFALAFGDNYCAIGACMLNKTCKQVYAFAMKDRINNVPRKSDDTNDQNSVKTKKFRHKDWHKNYTKVASLKETDGETSLKVVSSYIPCAHDANNVNCNEQPCCCIERSTFCEKFCNCSSDCPNRFPGCRCRARCDTKQCPCHLAVRECDPDLCPNCGACDFTSEEVRCQNVNIQRGLKQHLLLAPSDVAGWGCFIKNAVEKNAFISEYCGEIISQDEAERRGKVYDRLNCSFLFNLNEDLVVDATRKGNKIRFANHSVNPNCVAKVMMVNGDHRIGIFAKTAIAAGEELFFDYRYGPKEQLRFVGKERDRTN